MKVVVGDEGVEPKLVEGPDLHAGSELVLRGWVWMVECMMRLDEDSEGNPALVWVLRPLREKKIIVEGS